MAAMPRQFHWLALFVFSWVFPTIAFLPLQGTWLCRHRLETRTLSSPLQYYKNGNEAVEATSPRPPAKRKYWKDMYPKLQAFYEQHGHSNVTSSQDGGDPELFDWVRNLRSMYGTKKRSRLCANKLQLLQELDFCWESKNRFETMVAKLREFKDMFGHTKIRPDDEANAELYKWAKYIRYNYRHQALNQTQNPKSSSSRPKLSLGKMQVLQEVGFDWDTERRQNRWSVMLPRLREYKAKHGHTMVSMDDEDLELYRWTRSLIANYGPQLLNMTSSSSRPRLSQPKLEQLQQLGFEWKNRSSMWNRRYEELRAFSRKFGHCHVSTREYPQLGGFVQSQRREYRRYLAGNATSMTTSRIESLKKINFEWARSHDLAWEERREDLEDYLGRAGDANVPQDYSKNFALGQWCMNQRTKYRLNMNGEKTGLTQERTRRLEAVDFQWNCRQARWNAMCERLKQYQEDFGNLEIPTDDIGNGDLRQWLNEQRHFYRTGQSGRLTSERIDALESIPNFSWRRQRSGISKDDWSQLFVAIREKGIVPGTKAKEHIFDGENRFEKEIKTQWTEQELLALWNEENDEDEEDEFLEDEESRLFLRA